MMFKNGEGGFGEKDYFLDWDVRRVCNALAFFSSIRNQGHGSDFFLGGRQGRGRELGGGGPWGTGHSAPYSLSSLNLFKQALLAAGLFFACE
jgi:hypothetical protein